MFIIAVVVLGSLGAGRASAGQRVFTPVADAYVSEAAPHRSFGRLPRLRVGVRPRRRAYLRFDVAVPPGATIIGARLRLAATGRSRGTGYRVHATAGRMVRTRRLTDRTAPALGARLGASGPWRRARWVGARLRRDAIRAGVNVLGLSTPRGRAKTFASREAARRPQLVVTFAGPAPCGAPPAAACPPPAPPPPSAEAPPPVLLAAGDIQNAGVVSNPTAALLDGQDYDALLALGDNQYETGTLADYDRYYSQTWGRPAHKARTYPVAGNHERGSGDLSANHCAYFRTGAGGAAAVDPCPNGAPYYSFDLGSWHLVALDSSSGTIDLPQIAWLRADLAEHPAKCTLAFWHHPRYSDGPLGDNRLNEVWAPLMAAGADAVLVGHEHSYQRFARLDNERRPDPGAGIRQFVVGTGGQSHFTIRPATQPGLEVGNGTTFGVLRLTLHAGGYEWQFVPEAGRPFTDSGSESCH